MKRIAYAGVVALVLVAVGAGCVTDDAAESKRDAKKAVAVKESPKKEAPKKEVPKKKGNPVIVIETSMGTIKAELWPDKAKVTVDNFLAYVDAEFFDGLIFHRVIDGFMVQGGGFDEKFAKKDTNPQIKNEARADTPNDRGTLAMARTSDINSATGQFFINLKDNAFLNHRDESMRGFGYCVFGKVIEGMDIVDKIAKVKTGRKGPFPQDVPLETVVMKSVKRAVAE